jgi:SAM-dependent methyltransferase
MMPREGQLVGSGLAHHVQTTADLAARRYWETRARDWRVSPPLTPAPEDIAWYEATVAACARSLAARPLRAILLGVTPGIATMRWPAGTSLLAFDWAQGMVAHVWPRSGFPEQTDVVRADWRELPLAPGSIDLVVGDGCYAAMGSLAGARELNRELHRVLKRDGWYCTRAFCRADAGPSTEALFEELAGGVENLDLFRWRLAMAVHGESVEGVALGEVWRRWQRHVRDQHLDARRWSADQRLNMARWENVEARFSFPSMRELSGLAEPGFDLVARDLPSYGSAEHFPRLLMRARP